jgi:hypothetical protein
MPTKELVETSLRGNPGPGSAITERSPASEVATLARTIPNSEVEEETSGEGLSEWIPQSAPKFGLLERFYLWFERISGPC